MYKASPPRDKERAEAFYNLGVLGLPSQPNLGRADEHTQRGKKGPHVRPLPAVQ